MALHHSLLLTAGAFGLPALALTTAGAMLTPRHEPYAVHMAVPPLDGESLLRQLSLDVPAGLDDDTAAPLARRTAPPPFVAASQSPDDAVRASDCLTAAVYYEARSEPVDGQRAVAQVVLNRVRDRAFPNSVCGVVYQGSERHTGCQFSFTCDGSMNRPRDPSAWERARAVAEAALGGAVYAPVGTATYYHAMSVLPWWASSFARIGAVGTHIFYRWAGALERALAFRQSYAGVEPTIGSVMPATLADDGVTVHRGEMLADAPAVAMPETPATPETPAAAFPGLHIRVGERLADARAATRTVSGVRVHVGLPGDATGSAPGPI